MPPLRAPLLQLVATWSLLLLGGALAPAIGSGPATLLASGAAAALAVRVRRARGALRPLLALPGLCLGLASFPLLALLVLGMGDALGLAPRPPAEVPSGVVLAALTVGPLFEELLYRECLLPTLRRRLGAPLAVVVTSALFVLPHRDPWARLASALSGPLLAALFLHFRSPAPGLGFHVGLNLGAALSSGP